MNYLFLQIFVAFCVFTTLAIIPDYLHVCKQNDVNISKCINNSINHLRVRFPEGIKELDVPPMEPMKLSEITLKIGPPSAAILCNITNLKVWKPSTFVITELIPNLTTNTFFFKVWLPELHFKGHYDLKIHFYLINKKARGPVDGNFTNYHAEILMKGAKIIKNNEEYLNFDKVQLKLEIGKSKIRLENLFHNDALLKQFSDDLINDNPEIFVNEIKPTLETALAEMFTEIANKIALKFKYKELFPQ
ncbi:hypothetical protein FQA39_LY11319 [Lamprigera yunnana]|nr:hypothetical protein FQA39_LY11319 [Lamprigera yunnana]